MKDHLNDLANDLRAFGEGKARPTEPMAKDMQLRDYFAGQMMPLMVSDYGFEYEMLEEFAEQSYAVADALIRARGAAK
jgi:hypothetical protein